MTRIERIRARRGAAFLMLVVMLLFAIVGATRMLVRGEVSTRRAEAVELRAVTLERAIGRTRELLEVDGAELRLPVDRENDVWVAVSMSEAMISARWLERERVLDELHRPADSDGLLSQ